MSATVGATESATESAMVGAGDRAPRGVLVAAATVPLLVVGGFALVAVVPVGLVLRRVLASPGLRWLRPGAVALAAAYAVPLVLWAVLPDRAPSLTKDMHPASAALVVVAALGFLVLGLRGPRQATGERHPAGLTG